MAKSILTEGNIRRCYICGANGYNDPLEKHHIFGASNRKHSEDDGLYVWLCGDRCHRNGPRSAHRCKETSDRLKREGQRAWEATYGTREEFMARYGRNYLDT